MTSSFGRMAMFHEAVQGLLALARTADWSLSDAMTEEAAGLLARAGRYQEALAFVQGMTEAMGYWPGASVLADCLACLHERGMDADDLLDLTAAILDGVTVMERSDPEPAVVDLAEALAQRRLHDLFPHLLDRLSPPRRQAMAGWVAISLAKEGRLDEALSRITPTTMDPTLLWDLCQLTAKSGRVEQTLALARPLARSRLAHKAVGALARVGRLDEAMALAEELPPGFNRCDGWIQLLRVLSLGDQWEKQALLADRTMREMIVHHEFSPQFLGELAQAQCRVLGGKKSVSWFREWIVDQEMITHFAGHLADALLQSGKIEETRDLIDFLEEEGLHHLAKEKLTLWGRHAHDKTIEQRIRELVAGRHFSEALGATLFFSNALVRFHALLDLARESGARGFRQETQNCLQRAMAILTADDGLPDDSFLSARLTGQVARQALRDSDAIEMATRFLTEVKRPRSARARACFLIVAGELIRPDSPGRLDTGPLLA